MTFCVQACFSFVFSDLHLLTSATTLPTSEHFNTPESLETSDHLTDYINESTEATQQSELTTQNCREEHEGMYQRLSNENLL